MNAKRAIALLLTLVLSLSLCACTAAKPKETPNVVDIDVVHNIPLNSGMPYLFLDDKKTNIGIYLNTVAEINALEIVPPVIAWFEQWYGYSSREKLSLCGSHQLAIPFISWEPQNISLKDISDGKHDEYIRGYFTRLAIICPDNDVLVRFAHEMEPPGSGENWYSWQEGDPEAYRAAWIHLVELGRKINPNIKWVWSPNCADVISAPYYPGDKYVDYVGVTLNLPLDLADQYTDFEDFYTRRGIRERLEQYGKKIVISEAAYPSNDPEAKAAYMQSILDYAERDRHICAVVLFNEDKGENKLYRFTEDEACMQIVHEGIRRNEK